MMASVEKSLTFEGGQGDGVSATGSSIAAAMAYAAVQGVNEPGHDVFVTPRSVINVS